MDCVDEQILFVGLEGAAFRNGFGDSVAMKLFPFSATLRIQSAGIFGPVLLVMSIPVVLQLLFQLYSGSRLTVPLIGLLATLAMLFIRRDDAAKCSMASIGRIELLIALCLAVGSFVKLPGLMAISSVAAVLVTYRRWRRETGSRPLRDVLLVPVLAYLLTQLSVQNRMQGLVVQSEASASRMLFGLGIEHYRADGMFLSCESSGILYAGSDRFPSIEMFVLFSGILFVLNRRPLGNLLWYLPAAVLIGRLVAVVRILMVVVLQAPRPLTSPNSWLDGIWGIIGMFAGWIMLASVCGVGDFLTDRVPEIRERKIEDVVRNPLIDFWNWLFGHTSGKAADRREKRAAMALRSGDGETVASNSGRRNRLRACMRSVKAFFTKWYFSRRLLKLLAAIPFFCVLLTGLKFPQLTETEIHAKLESLLITARNAGDMERQRLLLAALSSLEGDPPGRRFQQALLLVRMGDIQMGLELMRGLSSERGTGYGPARLWLVEQSLSEKPYCRLDPEEIYRQLSLADDENPSGSDQFRLRALFYEQQNEGALAEKWLQKVVETQPEQYLVLARLQKKLNRSPETVQSSVLASIPALEQRLEEDPLSIDRVCALAEAWILADRESEARNLLTKLLGKSNDERLRKMLTNMDIADCRRKLSVSSLAGLSAMRTILGALRRTPADQEAAELLLQVHAGGVSFSAADVEATIASLRSNLETNVLNVQSAYLLSRILAAIGDFAEAIRVLKPVAEQTPGFRFQLAQYQLQAGQQSDAEQVLAALAADCLKVLSVAPEDVSLMKVYVDSLIMIHRSEEALLYLNQQLRAAPDSALVTPEWNAKLKSMRASASLALFDQKTGYSPEKAIPGSPAMSEFVLKGVERADYPKLMSLLKTATTTEATRDAAIQRICGLAMETGPLARRADALMLELRSEGTLAVSVLNIAGMEAMLRKQPQQAIEYLEMGNVLAERKDPLILNNLAVAILKAPERDLRKALQCSVQALELVPDHPDLLATQGEILLIMGRAADAVTELQKSLREDSSNSQTHLLIAEAYERLKLKQKAEEHRELATSLNAEK